jgi:hypothetical protein
VSPIDRPGRRGLLIALVLAVGACATRSEVRVLPFPATGTQPALHIQGIFTYESALATIGAVFERDFGFPPIVATAHLYPDARRLEAELLAVGYDPELARDAATRMRAIALHRRVLVNDGVSAEAGWPARVGTLAHELVHCLQYELGGGRRGTSDQWLREGFAELMSLRLLERIQAIAPGMGRRWLADELAGSNLSQAPRLDAMRTFRQWVALAGRSEIAPHAQAVLAVDRLVEQQGIPAVLDYFSRFATREDPAGNFQAAFGQTREAFEADLERALGIRRP